MASTKTIIPALALCAASAASAAEPGILDRWDARDASITREGPVIDIDFTLDLTRLDVPSQQALLLTPVLRGADGADSLELAPVAVYGRDRYYHYKRRGEMLGGAGETTFRSKDRPDTCRYSQAVPYQPWMAESELALRASAYGCCFTVLGASEKDLTGYTEVTFDTFTPVYLSGEAEEVLTKELSGQAWIQFPVNRTDIEPEMYNNPAELGRITQSIDTVKADPDFTITEVWLKGYASPESPYAHNADLARGRVDTLKRYIDNLYRFAPGTITTEYEPEDWAGLRAYVASSNIDNREDILAIIDTDMDPDAREALIKKRYPEQYRFLLQHAYPPLRHTDYRIRYTVSKAADIDEIKHRLATEPGKLTLNDFYLAANTCEPGSEEFKKVFDVAVRMYPDNPVANLNAANAALQSGQLQAAATYLAKAGDAVEADYSRGILLTMREDYSAALPYVQRAAAADLPGAADLLAKLEKVIGQSR